jgi:chemotaxis protein CheD
MDTFLPNTATVLRPTAPPVVSGFESIQRSFDTGIGAWTAKILPGEYYVTRSDEAITTVLGSCIAACIRDPISGAGGMNHFMLPEESGGLQIGNTWLDPAAGLATRYGSYAMESLINGLLKLGSRRERLEVKLFGAGQILASVTDVGMRNIEFVHHYCRTEGLRVLAEDLGDICPRRVAYFPATGKVRVRHLKPLEATRIAESERRYLSDIAKPKDTGGDVELFE